MICWALGAALAWAPGVSAQQAEESIVKAAFVYNFIVFTEWPAHALPAGATIDVCVNSGSPMASSLAILDGKPIKGTHIRLLRLDSLKDMPPSCRVVYLDRLSRPAWPQIRRQLAQGMLTVSDDGEIFENGAMIGLSTRNNRIVFEIDLRAAEKAGLRMNSKLLRLAKKVR